MTKREEDKSREMMEILINKIRYFQRIDVDSLDTTIEMRGKTEHRIVVPESHPNFEQVIETIHWVADFVPEGLYPWRIDVIKNQLWVSIGL